MEKPQHGFSIIICANAPVKNLFAVDYQSFLSGLPSGLSIQALSEIDALKFSKETVELLVDISQTFDVWMRKLHEKSLIVAYDRIATLITISATEPYKKLLQDESYFLDMFSNYLITIY